MQFVSHWVAAMCAAWGRPVEPLMVSAYLAVAEPYSLDCVEDICNRFLREGRQMALPVHLADALRAEVRIKQNSRRYLTPTIERASADVARKAVEEFFRRTGQKRGR